MSKAIVNLRLAVSAQANPAKPVLSAALGRSQNRQLMRGGKV